MKIGIVKKRGKLYAVLFAAAMIIGINVFSVNIVYAATTKTDDIIVDVEVSGDDNGQVKSGAEIEILYKLSNLKNIYAASMQLTYDNTLIKVNSIEPCISGNIYPAYKDTAKDGNKARFAFTFLGSDEPGLTGKTDFVKIQATVLRDGQLDVKKNNTVYEMVQKVDNNMKKIDVSYMNSPGESVKVENVGQESSSADNKSGSSSSEGIVDSGSFGNTKVNNEEKVTVLGTDNSARVVSNEEEVTEEINKEGSKTLSEENGEVSTSEKEEAEADSQDNENNKKEDTETVDKNSNFFVIGLIFIGSITIFVSIYLKKRKNA